MKFKLSLGTPPLLIWLVFIGFLLALKGTAVIGSLHSNIAWVNLNSYLGQTWDKPKISSVTEPFAQALQLDSKNRSAWFGSGMAHALRQQTDKAIRNWSNSSNDIAALHAYGLNARRKGNLDIALTLFRAGDTLETNNSRESHYLAGTICRLTLARQIMLSSQNSQYCADYLANNANNLMVNPHFTDGSLSGWGGEHYFMGRPAARLSTEREGADGNHVARLDGLGGGNHFGIFQDIYLAPGDQVHFKGKFRTVNDDNLQARFLFVSWQDENGTIQGNQAKTHDESMGWTEVERLFTVPTDVETAVNFYPIVFSGKGTIWLDDITVELVNE